MDHVDTQHQITTHDNLGGRSKRQAAVKSAERTKVMIEIAEQIKKNPDRLLSLEKLQSNSEKLLKKYSVRYETCQAETAGHKAKSDAKRLPFKLKLKSPKKLSPCKNVTINTASCSAARSESPLNDRPNTIPEQLKTLQPVGNFARGIPVDLAILQYSRALITQNRNSGSLENIASQNVTVTADAAAASTGSREPQADPPPSLPDDDLAPDHTPISEWVECTEEVTTSESIDLRNESTPQSMNTCVSSSSHSQSPISTGNHSTSSATSQVYSMSSTNSLEDDVNHRAKPCSSSSATKSSFHLTYTHKPVFPAFVSSSLSSSMVDRNYSRVPLRFYRHHSHDLMMTCDSEEFHVTHQPETSECEESNNQRHYTTESCDLDMTCETFDQDNERGDHFSRHKLEPVQMKTLNNQEILYQSSMSVVINHTKLKKPFFKLDLNDPNCPPVFKKLSVKQIYLNLSTGSIKYQNGSFLTRPKNIVSSIDTQRS